MGPGKVFIVLFVLIAGFFAYRFVKRYLERQEQAQRLKRQEAEKQQPSPPERLVACPACGTYVSASHPVHCGRNACPY